MINNGDGFFKAHYGLPLFEWNPIENCERRYGAPFYVLVFVGLLLLCLLLHLHWVSLVICILSGIIALTEIIYVRYKVCGSKKTIEWSEISLWTHAVLEIEDPTSNSGQFDDDGILILSLISRFFSISFHMNTFIINLLIFILSYSERWRGVLLVYNSDVDNQEELIRHSIYTYAIWFMFFALFSVFSSMKYPKPENITQMKTEKTKIMESFKDANNEEKLKIDVAIAKETKDLTFFEFLSKLKPCTFEIDNPEKIEISKVVISKPWKCLKTEFEKNETSYMIRTGIQIILSIVVSISIIFTKDYCLLFDEFENTPQSLMPITIYFVTRICMTQVLLSTFRNFRRIYLLYLCDFMAMCKLQEIDISSRKDLLEWKKVRDYYIYYVRPLGSDSRVSYGFFIIFIVGAVGIIIQFLLLNSGDVRSHGASLMLFCSILIVCYYCWIIIRTASKTGFAQKRHIRCLKLKIAQKRMTQEKKDENDEKDANDEKAEKAENEAYIKCLEEYCDFLTKYDDRPKFFGVDATTMLYTLYTYIGLAIVTLVVESFID